eukprot:symbB.v1.2.027982.t1/scaffold2913.1/size110177/3
MFVMLQDTDAFFGLTVLEFLLRKISQHDRAKAQWAIAARLHKVGKYGVLRCEMPEGDASNWNWPSYVASWCKADIAIPSHDFRTTYTVSVSQRILQITSHDGLQPYTVQDTRRSDLSSLPEVQKKKKKGDLGLSFGVAARPIGLAFAVLEDAEYLLILLSSGQLLAASTVQLNVMSLLASLPEVSDDHGAGRALTVLLGWSIVASGSKLGLVDIAEGVSHTGSGAKAFDLPKGTSASMVMSFQQVDDAEALFVGCSTGCLLMYSCGIAYKGQVQRLNLSLVLTLDISGSVLQKAPPAGFRSSVSGFFGRSGRSRTPPKRSGDSSLSDAAALSGDSAILAACGGSGNGPGSLLTAWQSSDRAKDCFSSLLSTGSVLFRKDLKEICLKGKYSDNGKLRHD